MQLEKIKLILNKLDVEVWRNVSEYRVGDIIWVIYQEVTGSLRVREFLGICISRLGKDVNGQICLRNIRDGVGIEISFFTRSTRIIEIKKVGWGKERYRKAKLYYLWDKAPSWSKVV